jgi:leucyl-tRNA synthetase
MGPPEKDAEWLESGIEGVYRFVFKLWNLFENILPLTKNNNGMKRELSDEEYEIRRKLHMILKKITNDIEGAFRFNTVVSGFMELVNIFSDYVKSMPADRLNVALLDEFAHKFVPVLSPFTPHVAEELWEMMGEKPFVTNVEWPSYDEDAIKPRKIEIALMINGKVRSKIVIDADLSEDEIRQIALNNDKIKNALNGKNPKKVFVAAGNVVNIVA